jgi:hypothetical protein
MSDQDRCPNGSLNCEFDDQYNVELVSGLMSFIAQHNEAKSVNPCPLCLRDAILAVAALLHLEAARIGPIGGGKPRIGGKRAGDAFAKAARDRLAVVIQANAAIAGRHRNG